ncbi:YciI family protein [Piscinibacter sp. HJYY11]|uniref:YciI family protein n=1 Tax=Piscinibacter sp. HJYY11 TaxID=2801333 RepID=UPI0038571954
MIQPTLHALWARRLAQRRFAVAPPLSRRIVVDSRLTNRTCFGADLGHCRWSSRYWRAAGGGALRLGRPPGQPLSYWLIVGLNGARRPEIQLFADCVRSQAALTHDAPKAAGRKKDYGAAVDLAPSRASPCQERARCAGRPRRTPCNSQVQDGPFADTHEHLGGYFVVDTASLDDALEWAARAPCASAGSVEVRPVLPPMDAQA